MKGKQLIKKIIICILITVMLMNDILPSISVFVRAEEKEGTTQQTTEGIDTIQTIVPSESPSGDSVQQELNTEMPLNTENPASTEPSVTSTPEASELPQPEIKAMELKYTKVSDTELALEWDAFEENENIQYVVYRNSFPIYTGNENKYSDKDVSVGNIYFYRVETKDALGNTIGQSPEIEVGMYSSLTIEQNANITLTENMSVSDLVIKNGTLNLNGYSLTVYGNTTFENGYLQINKGYLHCKNNFYYSTSWGYFTQNNVNDYILVEGSFIKTGSLCHRSDKLSNGTLEVRGDFIQQGSRNDNSYFEAGENHKTLLSGTGLQTVKIENEKSCFGILELQNYSEEGIYSSEELKIKNLIKNGCKLEYGIKGTEGWTLSEDQEINGDIYLNMGELNLNGYTLRINGNLIQGAGIVNINGGNLEVKGDYRVQSITSAENAGEYGISSGKLIMTNPSDYVGVEGSFIIQSSEAHQGLLTEGVLDVKGDFEEIKTYVNCFSPSNNHRLLMSGDGKQTIKINNSTKHTSYINILETTNKSEEGIELIGNLAVIKEVRDNKNAVTGGSILYYSGMVFKDSSFSGSVAIVDSITLNSNLNIGNNIDINGYLNLNGYKLTVHGDVNLKGGHLYNQRGQLICMGNFSSSNSGGELHMNYPEDYILVNGDFYWAYIYNIGDSIMTDGILEVKGNFTQKVIYSSYQKGFVATKNNKIILSGDSLQTVNMEGKDSYINILEITNTSNEGVYYQSRANFSKLILNGCKITYAQEGEAGRILEEDTVIDGDLYLIGGEMDLNGHTLTVNGNIIQEAGIININGGKLLVKGDYRIQGIENSGEEVKYISSTGVLNMTNAMDYVEVEGSFITSSKISHTGKLTEGILDIKGDFKQYRSDSYDNFITSGKHTVIFSGTKAQKVEMEHSSVSNSRFTRMEIKNSSDDGVEISENIYVTSYINDNGNQVKGAIRYVNSLVIENGVFNGNIVIVDSVTLNKDVKIIGFVKLIGNLNIYGRKLYAGEIIHTSGELYVGNGQLIVEGDYNMPSLSYGYIYMGHNNGYILINGDFNISTTNTNQRLTAGTIEIKGNFKQEETTRDYINFKPSGSHKTILSGDGLQTVYFKNLECGFNILEINNHSEEGIYSENPIPAVNFIRNGCKVTYGSKGEYGYTLKTDEERDELYLLGDELDLNGHTLRIKGNLVQMGGVVNINNGKLIVEGDYLIQMEKEENGVILYKPSSGILNMTKPEDYVQVKGDFVTRSNVSHDGRLTEGTLEINGNLIQYNMGVQSNLKMTEKHTLLIKGEKVQNITFGSSSGTESKIQNLIIENSSEEGILFVNEVWVTGHINDNNNKINGSIVIITNTSFENNTFNGNILIRQSYSISNNMVFNGNLSIYNDLDLRGNSLYINGSVNHSYGNIYFNKGSIFIKGGYTMETRSSAQLQMKYPEDYICIEGDFLVRSDGIGTCNNGIMELKGNFINNYRRYSAAIITTGNHRLIMSGNHRQDINFLYDGNQINILEIKNESEEGVHVTGKAFATNQLIRNNNILVYPNSGLFGWTLSQDTTIEGDLTILEEALDLNGYKLTVKGDLIQAGGVVNVNGGELRITGSYRIQTKTGENSYGSSGGKLIMTKPEDLVIVEKDFINSSVISHTGLLTDGTLEVRGNFEGNTVNAYDNFNPTKNHTVVFSGDKQQTVRMDNSNPSYSYFNNLVINNTSKEGVVLNSTIWSLGKIEDKTQNVKGTLSIKTLNNIKSPVWSGDIYVNTPSVLEKDVEILGRIDLWSDLDLNQKVLRVGSMAIYSGNLYLKGGKLYCKNNFHMDHYWYNRVRLYMNNEEDYIFVGGNFNTNISTNQDGCMTAGLLEIQGDFIQNTANYTFSPEGTHRTKFSSKISQTGKEYKQTISFYNSESKGFNTLILTKDIDTGYFINNLSKDKLFKELIYELEDREPPTSPKNLKAKKAGDTRVTLEWETSSDNKGVAGYEIYRNKVRVAVVSGLSYTDTGVQPDSSYDYYVKAFDRDRNYSESSNIVTVLTEEDKEVPEAPKNLKIKNRSGSSITLSWSPSYDNTGVKKYEIIRDGEKIDEVKASTTYKDSNLKKDKIYSYQVKAIDTNDNESQLSNEAKGFTSMPQITAISPVDSTTIGGETVKLTVRYKNTGNALGNKVKFEYSNDGKNWTAVSQVLIGQSVYSQTEFYSAVDWNIKRLGTGLYKVRATLYDEDMNTDEWVTEYSVDTQAPEIPEKITALSENGVVKLVWSPSISADCKEYVIYKAFGDSENFRQIAAVKDRLNVTYIDNDVIEGKTYKYKITAKDKFSQESSFTEEVRITVDKDMEAPEITCIKPEAKRINKAVEVEVQAEDNIGVNNITVSYKKETEESWTILGKETAENGKIKIVWDTTALNGDYIVKAEAEDVNGNCSIKEFTKKYEIDNTGISKIIISDASSTSSSVSLRWKDVTEDDFGYFIVEQKTGNTYKEAGKTSDTLGIHIKGLKDNTEYTFRVVGYDNLGNRGIPSEEKIVKTKSDTKAPVITRMSPKADYYNGNIMLEVNTSDDIGVKNILFQYSEDKTKWVDIKEVSAEKVEQDGKFSCEFNTDKVNEGKIYVRVIASDEAGNANSDAGEPLYIEYIIDRTAPEIVKGFTAQGNQGFVELNWLMGTETDIEGYRIYRAEEGSTDYRVLEDKWKYLNYYDRTSKYGTAYSYKIAVIDRAGNVSLLSDEVIAETQKDREKPVVYSASPENGSKVGQNPVIKALVADNSFVKEVLIEYKYKDLEEDIWTEIKNISVNEQNKVIEAKWDTKSLEEGNYIIRIIATDAEDNVSDTYEVAYTLDMTSPKILLPRAETQHRKIGISWKVSEAEDIGHYEILRKKASDEEFKLIGNVNENSYTDENVEPEVLYLYKIKAYDKCGNYSESKEITGTADDVDEIAPVAAAPSDLAGMIGMELAFDGSGSSDNVRITEYKWDMGNGDTTYGMQPVYTYDKAGEYYVILTVKDAGGNTARAYTKVKIYDKTTAGTLKIKVTDENGNMLKGSDIYLDLSEEGRRNLVTDDKGEAVYVVTPGTYMLAAYKQGYIAQDTEVVLNAYETKEVTVVLKKGDIVTGNFTVHRMELAEMAAAGIDFTAPENYHVFVFTINLAFEQRPLEREYVYIVNGGGKVLSSSSDDDDNNIIFQAAKTEYGGYYVEGETETETEPPILFYMSTTQSISWLKDMYNVSLGVINNASERIYIENAEAEIILPSGLSLAATKNGQSKKQKIDIINGQEQKNVTWYVKGDSAGSYNLEAKFQGTLMPFNKIITAEFKTKKPFEVTAGRGLKIYVTPEATAYPREDYYIQFALVNESGKIFYNLSHSFGPYVSPGYKEYNTVIENGEAVTYESTGEDYYVSGAGDTSRIPVIQGGDKITVGVFMPGESLYGTYKTHVRFPDTNENGDEVYYKLVESIAETLGDNTGVEVVMCSPVMGHVRKYITEVVELDYFLFDPIDVATGAYISSYEALRLDGLTTVSLDLNYNSMYTKESGEMGKGWNHNYEVRVEEEYGVAKVYWNEEQYNTFVRSDAVSRTVYGKKVNNQILIDNAEYKGALKYTCVSQGLGDNVLERKEDGTYILKLSNGMIYEFDKTGKVVKATDSNGRSVTLGRINGMLVVTDVASNHQITIKYNADKKVSEVCDNTGRKATFGYENGCLTTITDALGNQRKMTYDSEGRIHSDTDMEGNIIAVNTYDEKGRVLSQDDGNSNTPLAQLKYDEESEYARTIVDITDRNGNALQSVANVQGKIVRTKDKNGNAVIYTYDRYGNLASTKDVNGNTMSYTYDKSGNLLTTKDNVDNTTSMTYDDRGNILTVKDPDGIVTSYTYNNKNLMTSQRKQGTAEITYKYNENAQIIEETTEGLGTKYFYYYPDCKLKEVKDYKDNSIKYTYDKWGNINSYTDREDNTTTYEYDALGRILKETDSLGYTIEYGYDKNGNKVFVKNKDESINKYEYNSEGLMTKCIYPNGITTSYIYDNEGNLIKEETANKSGDESTSNTVNCTYDAEGNLLSNVINNENTTDYTYDARGNILTQTDNGGNTTTYTYYPNGKLHTVTDSEGGRQIYTYDSHWRLKGVTNPLGGQETYDYDGAGNIIKQRTALGNETTYKYDKYGRCIRATDPRGNSTEYEYDSAGNVISQKDAYGNIISYSYDKNDRAVGISRIKNENGKKRTLEVRMIYDSMGRNIKTVDELGNTIKTEYDAVGNVTAVYDASGEKIVETIYDVSNLPVEALSISGLETKYSYDPLGRLIKINENNKGKTQNTLYEYDRLGRLTKVTDGEKGVSRYEYDNVGNIAKLVNPNKGETLYTYDSVGRVKTEEILKGSLTSYTYNAAGLLEEKKAADNKKTTYKYDKEGRITSFTDELGEVSYVYDENGNITEVKDDKGIIKRTYDKLNRVETYTDYEGNIIRYGYDELGCLTSIIYPDNKTVTYEYYDNGDLKKVTDYKGRETEYSYDVNGRLNKITRPDNTVETRQYDKAGRLISQYDIRNNGASGGTVINNYKYTYDEKGNVTSKTGIKEDGKVLENAKMKYDDINRLIEYNGKEVIYDKNGNMIYGPLNGEMAEYEYDCRNRLIKAGNVSYEYDAENTRIAVTEGNTRTRYITDVNSSDLSKVLITYETEEENPEKTKAAYYVYGNGLISEEGSLGYLTYHFDNIGSTTALTDKDGKVFKTFNYGPYGELENKDTAGIKFLYNGELGVITDSNGLYYMRARYYNSQIKRFINQDVITGSITRGSSLNRYSYVEGNPITLTDPFGLCTNMSWSDIGHGLLNLLGLAPGIGEIFDIANAVWYFAEGDIAEGSTCLMSALPIFGTAAGGIKLFSTGAKTAKAVSAIQKGCRVASNTFTFGRAAADTLKTGIGLYDEYVNNGKSLDGNFWLGIGSMVLNGAAMSISGKSLRKDVKEIGISGSFLGKDIKTIGRGIKGVTFEGTIYRNVKKGYDPLEMSDYTINSDHRYTEKGVPGLYFSSGEKIVEAELKNYDIYDLSNRTMHSYDVKSKNMLDVSNPSVRKKLGISLESIVGESYDVTHATGRYAYSNGYNGIIAPSARADGGVNIILFDGSSLK